MNWRIAACPASTFSACAPTTGSFMNESAVRIVSVTPTLLVKVIDCVSLLPSDSAMTVFVVPKSSPSARAIAVPLVIAKLG